MEHTWYKGAKPPSLIASWPDTSCSVMLTKRGYINFVGGYTREEMECYLIKFLGRLHDILLEIYPDLQLKITHGEMKNGMATAKLRLQYLNCFKFHEYLNKIGVNSHFEPEEQHVISVMPYVFFILLNMSLNS